MNLRGTCTVVSTFLRRYYCNVVSPFQSAAHLHPELHANALHYSVPPLPICMLLALLLGAVVPLVAIDHHHGPGGLGVEARQEGPCIFLTVLQMVK